MKRKSLIILFVILLLGLALRIYKIYSMPLYGDELTMVYDSYSILKTGKDQTGEVLPLTFKMGAGRPAGYVYFSIPFVAIFGPSVWGVRGLSIFSGLGITILMYFLGKKLFNEKTGLIASLLASISLWDIYLSRAGFEAHFALFLALFGVVMFLYKKYIPMAFFWGLSIFTYPTFKLTIPLLFLFLIFFRGIKETLKSRTFIFSILVLAVFAGFAINETFKGVSEERFLSINIFSDINLRENITQKINEQRNLSTIPEVIKPLIYNKPLRYSRILFENYIKNLSPNFLYLRGDGNPRHNPGEMGMFYLVEIPLLFAGLYFLAKGEKKNLLLIVSWILIVPLATMLMGDPHGLRNNFMIPPFILISAYAITKISKKINIIVFTLISIQLMSVLMTIYFYAPNKFGSFWSSRAHDVALDVISKKDKYETVVLSTNIDNIEYAYIAYAKVDPNEVISQYRKLPKIFGNIVITDDVSNYINIKNTLVIKE